jgi:hypothetical protein
VLFRPCLLPIRTVSRPRADTLIKYDTKNKNATTFFRFLFFTSGVIIQLGYKRGGVMSQTNRQSQDGLRDAIKRYSKNLRISQVELAGLASVSQPLVSGFVSGKLNVSPSAMARLQKALFQLVGERASAVGLFIATPPRSSEMLRAEA